MRLEDVKVGMKVVPFRKTTSYSTNLSDIFKPGDKYMVVSHIAYDEEVKLGDSNGGLFNASDFEPYEEVVEMKVGDSVKIISDSNTYKDFNKYIGTIHVIEYIKGDKFYLKGINDDWKPGFRQYYTEDELELTQDKPEEEYTITITTDNKKYVKLVCGDIKVKARCNLQEDAFDLITGIKLAVERLEEAKSIKAEEAKHKLKIGDIVYTDVEPYSNYQGVVTGYKDDLTIVRLITGKSIKVNDSQLNKYNNL